MSDDGNRQIKVKVGCHEQGALWAAGWIFTIGYLKLTFWKAVLAIIIWPYYIGVTVRALTAH